ncbi:Cys-Gln thioester bond-forming surface protein [Tautonia rosea]|uniref:Cys-Gln thioester bond-forming surface protein n=1 Tax=Tautonia rosea TaxID=2728037 RepID=UPI0014727310|nr:Cys-Gln thioester bond-forming surface protein [Tautonia rosea]
MIRTFIPAPKARGPSRGLGLLGLAALVAASLAAQSAQAGQMVLAQSTYGGNSVTVNGTYNNGSISFGTGNVRAGLFTTSFFQDPSNPNVATSTFDTYCIDLATNNVGNLKEVAEVSVTSTTGGPSTVDAEGAARNIGAAGWVLSTYGDKTVAELKTEFSSITGISNLNAAQAQAAIQVAIWLAAYGESNLTFTGGTNAGANRAIALANAIVAKRNGQTTAAGFINYPPIVGGAQTQANQDMIFLPPEGGFGVVPEPSTLAMAAFGGLIGLGMMGRKRLRARKATA